MQYDHYQELYEAIYLFECINKSLKNDLPILPVKDRVKDLGIDLIIYQSLLKILYVNDLLSFDNDHFHMTKENLNHYDYLQENVIKKDPYKQFPTLFHQAKQEQSFFFDNLTDHDYEIYSRCNFDYTYMLGRKSLAFFQNTFETILELGGNSGGFATAYLNTYPKSSYTIIDQKIPCKVGNEFKSHNEVNINFIEENILELKLDPKLYDGIVMMNLLHDFDDCHCHQIIKKSLKYCHNKSRFIIIEDILDSNLAPKSAIMHGLRLSIACKGGRQRTINEMAFLFSKYGFKIHNKSRLSDVNMLLEFSRS